MWSHTVTHQMSLAGTGTILPSCAQVAMCNTIAVRVLLKVLNLICSPALGFTTFLSS